MIQLPDSAKPKLERLRQILEDIKSKTVTVGYDSGDSGINDLAEDGLTQLKDIIPVKIKVES